MPEENRVILLQRLVLREAVLLLWESRCASLDYCVEKRRWWSLLSVPLLLPASRLSARAELQMGSRLGK